jgi:DNA-binding response OmpR family regulator
MKIDALIVGGSFRAAKQLEAVLAEVGLDTVIATRDDDAIDSCRMARVGVIVLLAAQDPAGGARTCAALRGAVRPRGIPILAITCEREPWQDLSLLDAGADDCLSLPDETSALCSRVKGLLELGRLRSERLERGVAEPAGCDQSSRAIRIAVVDPVAERRHQTASLLSSHFPCSQIEGPSILDRAMETCDVILVASSCLRGARGLVSRPVPPVRKQGSPLLLLMMEPGEDPADYRGIGGIDEIVMRPVRVATTRARIRCLAARRMLSSERPPMPANLRLGTIDPVMLSMMDRRRAA